MQPTFKHKQSKYTPAYLHTQTEQTHPSLPSHTNRANTPQPTFTHKHPLTHPYSLIFIPFFNSRFCNTFISFHYSRFYQSFPSPPFALLLSNPFLFFISSFPPSPSSPSHHLLFSFHPFPLFFYINSFSIPFLYFHQNIYYFYIFLY